MDQTNQVQKIVLIGFVAFGLTAAYVTRTLLEVFAATSGWFAQIYDSLLVQHGGPVVAGVGTFALCMLKPSIRKWGEEVVIEVGKVVWPSRKDTQALTIAVSFIVLLAGLLLGGFDVVTKQVVNFILNYQF